MSTPEIERGRDWQAQVKRYTDASYSTLTAHQSGTFTAELRAERDPTSTLLATFTVDDTDRASGTFVISLTQTQTAAIASTVDYAVFDIKTDGDVTVVPATQVKIVGRVTE